MTFILIYCKYCRRELYHDVKTMKEAREVYDKHINEEHRDAHR